MTIDEIKRHLAVWEAADEAISKNKSYTIDGLTYTRQDAEQVRKMLDYWSSRLVSARRAGGSIRRQSGVIHDIR